MSNKNWILGSGVGAVVIAVIAFFAGQSGEETATDGAKPSGASEIATDVAKATETRTEPEAAPPTEEPQSNEGASAPSSDGGEVADQAGAETAENGEDASETTEIGAPPADSEAATDASDAQSTEPQGTGPSVTDTPQDEATGQVGEQSEEQGEQQAEVQPEQTVAPNPSAQTAVAEPEPTPAPDAPVFDLVRAETDGNTLVAGRGLAGAFLEVLVDDVPEAETTLGQDGKFVSFLDLQSRYGARVLRLRMTQGDHVVLSQEDVIVVIPEPAPEPAPTVVAEATPSAEAETAQSPTGETETAQAEAAPADGEQPVSEQAATTEPAAPTVIKSTPEGVSVIPSTPTIAGEVTLDAVTYGDNGQVTFAGRGDAGASIQLYLDNALVPSSKVAQDGRWQAVLDALDPGRYLARVDQLDASGTVTARIEQEFVREAVGGVEPVAEAPKADETSPAASGAGNVAAPAGDTSEILTGPVRRVTIEAGNTLWAISRERYGDGKAYVKIFNANRELIRNPDLIYPGQVFLIPEE